MTLWRVSLKNHEGEYTGIDGGAGCGVRFYDENGNYKDVHVPNNGSISFICLEQDDGFLFEVYAKYAMTDYEDKIVEYTATPLGSILPYIIEWVHIGDNVSYAKLSHKVYAHFTHYNIKEEGKILNSFMGNDIWEDLVTIRLNKLAKVIRV